MGKRVNLNIGETKCKCVTMLSLCLVNEVESTRSRNRKLWSNPTIQAHGIVGSSSSNKFLPFTHWVAFFFFSSHLYLCVFYSLNLCVCATVSHTYKCKPCIPLHRVLRSTCGTKVITRCFRSACVTCRDRKKSTCTSERKNNLRQGIKKTLQD